MSLHPVAMSFRLFSKLRRVNFSKNGLRRASECTKAKTAIKKSKKGKKDAKEENPCVNATCPQPKKRKSFWGIFTGEKPKKPDTCKPDYETCRKQLSQCKEDPDLSQLGGTVYRTCGPAFVVQKDLVGQLPVEDEPEANILEKLEKHPDLKEQVDPMPPFESVESRLLKLCELGLHPDYKRSMSIPRKKNDLTLPKQVYKTRSGPIADEEYPAHLKLSKECLDRKNINAEFKRAVPPRQLLAKMLEMKQNERPTLERKADKDKKVLEKNES